MGKKKKNASRQDQEVLVEKLLAQVTTEQDPYSNQVHSQPK